MRKRLMVAFVAAAMVMGLAGVADAAKPGKADQDKAHETGEACPEASPRGAQDSDATPPPGCGQVDRDQGAPEGPNGPQECPPESQNPGGTPPHCGNQDPGDDECGDDEVRDEEGNCVPDDNNGDCPNEGDVRDEEGNCVPDDNNGDCSNEERDADGNCPDEVTTQECTDDLGQLVVGIPAAPLAVACVALGSVEDRDPPCPAGALETGAVNAHPLAKLCATVGPNG